MYAKDCLDTGWVSSVGQYVDAFENELVAYTGTKHAVATVNGTAALHTCLILAGVKHDDEVIVPSLTFVATANTVKYMNAVPHFADCELRTLGLDPKKLRQHLESTARMQGGMCVNVRTGRAIRAVICMHAFGHPADLTPLVELCAEWNLVLIEDAAESLGSLYKGIHTGNYGRISALSFNGNKIITTGGGGAVLTNDSELAAKAKHLTTTAKVPHPWEFTHDQVGYNYRMPNINAAIGVAQLERLPSFLAAKRKLAEAYKEAFSGIGGLKFIVENDLAISNYWLNLLLLDEARAGQVDIVLAALNDAGYMCRPSWRPMHRLDIFSDCPKMDLTVTDNLARRLICIPSSPNLINIENE